ncbi:lysozyme inhibitor LprI family protein [Roseixanthobacter glucoisosaccharinicivorans]|uniref:lysozyme inhibitor LprI family protein n=1 Tax=Roseixanthobacter glucoisosaccharinicivorans TaxID=3119923 RepID=UPI0037289B96
MIRRAFARRMFAGRARAPVAPGQAGAASLVLAAALLLGAPSAPAHAQPPVPAPKTMAAEPWAAAPRCRSGEVLAREYNRCLYDAIQVSEKGMEAALANAFAVIEARSDLLPSQRNRWRLLLDEAQIRYGMYRNFDCQSVAPFEGPRGIGNFEQRALCLIANNERRAEDLRRRYGEVPPPAAPVPAVVVENIGTRPATWLTAVARPLD